MPDIKMSSANAFVSHAINSAFIPRPVPVRYIVDYKEKYIQTMYSPSYTPSVFIIISKKYFRKTLTD